MIEAGAEDGHLWADKAELEEEAEERAAQAAPHREALGVER